MLNLKIIISFLILLIPNIAISDNMQISNLSDITQSWRHGDGDIITDMPICIYTQNGDYKLRAEGYEINSGKFRIFKDNNINGSPYIDYRVFWNEDSNGSNFEELRKRRKQRFHSPETTNTTCSNGLNNSTILRIVINDNELQSKSSGSYSGSLMLTISNN
ncbi:hypothetical protein N8772_03750 [Rickettsiales bacterium]|nr:hypothetical protein [Rickettsiales bacterium]MDB2550701.1 hypothetical protein [Rickettsiales bacterium]